MNLKPFLRSIKKASPIILSALSVIGVAATAVLSAKATVKALEKTENEDAADAWKCYIPTALVAIATAACIIGNGVLNRKQQASLLSAYALMERSYRQYRNKTVELYGEDADKKIICSLAVETPKKGTVIIHPGLTSTSTLDWGNDDEEIHHLFWDSFSERYFTSTISRVLQAEIAVNRCMNLSCGGFVTVNDFYNFLGLEPITGGDEIGWSVCDCYTFLDFDHYVTKLEDSPDGVNLEALVIDYQWLPQTADELDWA